LAIYYGGVQNEIIEFELEESKLNLTKRGIDKFNGSGIFCDWGGGFDYSKTLNIESSQLWTYFVYSVTKGTSIKYVTQKTGFFGRTILYCNKP